MISATESSLRLVFDVDVNVTFSVSEKQNFWACLHPTQRPLAEFPLSGVLTPEFSVVGVQVGHLSEDGDRMQV